MTELVVLLVTMLGTTGLGMAIGWALDRFYIRRRSSR